MKKGILFLLLISSMFTQAQSLKDALFGGKLKNDPGTVIRKGDDLATKIDSNRKAPVEDITKTKTTISVVDSSKKLTVSNAATDATATSKADTVAMAANPSTASETAATPKEPAAAPKDNNAIWKAYMDTLNSTLKTEVLSSKKIKSGSYYVLVSYTIGTDGKVDVKDVFISPENAFLQQQIKDRLAVDVPQLSPVLSDSGTPRKVSKKYNFTLVKQ